MTTVDDFIVILVKGPQPRGGSEAAFVLSAVLGQHLHLAH